MSEQLSLDYEAGQRAKAVGIGHAVERAGKKWLEAAITDFVRYLAHHGKAPLEDWRVDYLERGGEEPENHKAWGGVAQGAAKRGLIVSVGFTAARSVKTHGHPVRVWRVNGIR